jgi:LEA14-like dessication related protein
MWRNGSRTRLRIWRRKAWGFESLHPHHQSHKPEKYRNRLFALRRNDNPIFPWHFQLRLIFFFAVTAAFSSCLQFQPLEFRGIRSVTVDKLDFKEVSGTLNAEISNPNRFGFSIFPSGVDVLFGGKTIGKANLLKSVKIKGNTSATYSFALKGDLSALRMQDVLQMMSNSEAFSRFEFKGDLKAGKFFFIRKKIPLVLGR